MVSKNQAINYVMQINNGETNTFADKKCDGIVHCIDGEDETFENCKHIFPEEATINCNERPKDHYDVRDMAIPCNGIRECVDGKDELCEENDWILVGVVLALVIFTIIIYNYLKWYCLDWNQQNISMTVVSDGWNAEDCFDMFGDKLAVMKVRNSHIFRVKLIK